MELEKERYPVLKTLDEAGIQYELYIHQPIFTVEEGVKLLAHIPGRGSKNLFLRDKKGKQYFLLTVCEEKRVDLNSLGELFGVGRLSFGSPEKLKEYLSLEPGSVTMLGLLFDKEMQVAAYLDKELYDAAQMQQHPMKNDGSIVFDVKPLLRYFEAQGRNIKVISVPTR